MSFKEPDDHKLAAAQIVKWWESLPKPANEYDNGYLVYRDKKYNFDDDFIKTVGIKWTFHEADLAIYRNLKLYLIVEVDQKRDITIIFHGKEVKITKSRHNNPNQRKKDKIFQRFIEETYPNVTFLRIEKEDCFDKRQLNKLFSKYAIVVDTA